MKHPEPVNAAFLINTYNRKESLERLVQSIHKIDHRLHIYILDDGSEEPITKYKFSPYVFVFRQEHKGKPLYWQMI